jgi:ABC-type transporter Mla subunit MlaD
VKGQLRGVTGPLVKLVVFGLVTVLASYVLISTITNAGYGEQIVYRAEFTDVAGLVEGDEVRISGVRVGQVTGIGLAEPTDRSPRWSWRCPATCRCPRGWRPPSATATWWGSGTSR